MTSQRQVQARSFFENLAVRASEIRRAPPVDLHMHTTWTDGSVDVHTMWSRSVEMGLETILFSEHARTNSADWFPEFAAQVRALPDAPCRAMVGAEVKITDLAGNLDLAAAVRDQCDLIMASVHRFPGEEGQIMGTTGGFSADQAMDIEFRLSMAALDNPDMDILGHPFGMTIRRFNGEPHWKLVETLVGKCATTGKAFEINARYHPDPQRLLLACMDARALVSFGSNAHAPDEVGALLDHPGWTRTI